MIKRILIWTVAAFLVIGLLGAAIAVNQPATPQAETETGRKDRPELPTPDQSIEELIDSGKDYWCSFKNQSGSATGMVYMSQDKFRVELQKPDSSFAYLLFDGNWYYQFGVNRQPFKINTDQMAAEATVSARRMMLMAMGVSDRNKVACLPWQANEKTLRLPDGVIFTDLTEKMLLQKTATTSGTPRPPTPTTEGE